jgi:hypothetical protein
MPKEPPGPRLLRQFIESLGSLEDVDPGTAKVLQSLFNEGSLRSGEITAALRTARTSANEHDEDSQA